jgi:hypothetical protein
VNTATNGCVVPVNVQLSEAGTALTDANTPGPAMQSDGTPGRSSPVRWAACAYYVVSAN